MIRLEKKMLRWIHLLSERLVFARKVRFALMEDESELIKEMGLKTELQRLRMKWEGEDDVPQEIIRQYSDEIAKKYEMASDRIPENERFHIDEENFMEEFEEN